MFGDETWIGGADVEDVIGVLRGRDQSLPALLLMAHYDSVAGSPGAADDIAGVSTVLELVRALKTRGQPERDVVVALTDGEEAGLLGARLFFAADPLSRHVGFVMNFEARGGGGRAAMFETGAMNGGTVDLFRRTAIRPDSNSLAVFVYKLLPNDTDFSIAKARGLPGMNYAFIGRQFDYHSPSSTVAALDQGSVQHMGDEALGAAEAVAFSRSLPPRAPDKVYSDVFGWRVIAYPPWVGWLVTAVAGLLLAVGAARAAGCGRLDGRGALTGAGLALVILVFSIAAVAAVRMLTGVGIGFLAARPLLARFPLFEAASGLAATGAIVLGAALFAGRERRLPGLWAGLLLVGFVMNVLAQALAPLTAFLIAWPLLLAALAGAAAGLERPRAPATWILLGGAAILATAWLLGVGHTLLQGLDLPGAAAPLALIAAFALLPLAWPAAARARGVTLGLGLVAAALAIALWLRLTSPWTARHPQAAEPLYIVNAAAGRAWRADAAAPPGRESAWSQAMITADGGRVGALAGPFFPGPIAAAPARPVAVSDPDVRMGRSRDGRVEIGIRPTPGATRLRIDIRSNVAATDGRIDGLPAAVLTRPGRWTHLWWEAAPEGLTLSFVPAGPGGLDVRWADATPGWPLAAAALPRMPRTVMGWDLAGSTLAVGHARLNF